ncbi:MAG: methyltransferase [Prolixibacteraceae bacterium]
MEKLIVFGILSIPLIVISWRTLFSIKSHGFYRFLSWECILWLAVSNFKYWFLNPFGFYQILSWIFLVYSVYLVIAGTRLLKKTAKAKDNRNEQALYAFERTAELITTGIFNYIRHPMYSSLLFLTWGIFLKNTDQTLLPVSLISTVLLYITARIDEQECLNYFGEKYRNYMLRTKMFVPFLF